MKLFLPAIVLLAASVAAPAAAGDVKLQLANGRVTLQARDATVREILAEWARVGKVRIVNAEKVMGAPVTLDLQDVPEAQALNTLLRSVSGYMAAQKSQPVGSASAFDAIVILATPRPPIANASYTAPPTQATPAYRVMQAMPNPGMLDDQDEPSGPPPTYPGAPGYPRGVMAPPNANPGAAPQAPPAPGTVPQGAPGTVSPMPYQPQPGGVRPGGSEVPSGLPTGAAGTVSAPQPPKKPGGPGGPGGERQ